MAKKLIKSSKHVKEMAEKFGHKFKDAVGIIYQIKMNPSPMPDPNAKDPEKAKQIHRSTVQIMMYAKEGSVEKSPLDIIGETINISPEDYSSIQEIISKYV